MPQKHKKRKRPETEVKVQSEVKPTAQKGKTAVVSEDQPKTVLPWGLVTRRKGELLKFGVLLYFLRVCPWVGALHENLLLLMIDLWHMLVPLSGICVLVW